MTYDTAVKCINDALFKIEYEATVEFIFFGGEPLLQFELIKRIVSYTLSQNFHQKCRFFAATNGTLLTNNMKEWLIANKEVFILGLSLDGTPSSHNINRSNSYKKIDINFFRETWPQQNVKMTVSKRTLSNYANDVIHLHSLGFGINGGDLCLGKEDWKDKKFLDVFAQELLKLIEYYDQYENAPYNAIFDIDLALCSSSNRTLRKNCGIGDKLFFYDTDGKLYPCSFITPMSFSASDLAQIESVKFNNPEEFVDKECYDRCYLYPICKRCPAENYIQHKSFRHWHRDKCEFVEIIALSVAEIEARRILKNPKIYNDTKLYYLIEAIKKIREIYCQKYNTYFHRLLH